MKNTFEFEKISENAKNNTVGYKYGCYYVVEHTDRTIGRFTCQHKSPMTMYDRSDNGFNTLEEVAEYYGEA